MDDMAASSALPQPDAGIVTQTIDPSEREAVLNTRRTILNYFSQRSRFDHTSSQRWEANGDVVSDILLAHQHERLSPHPGSGLNLIRDIVQYLYGVSDLLRGSEYPTRINLYNPTHTAIQTFHDVVYDNFLGRQQPDDALPFYEAIDEFTNCHRAMQSERVARGVFGANHTLLRCEDMLAILNARGTVLLNAAFAGRPEQNQIVNLATLAVDVYHGIVPGLQAFLGPHFLALIRDEVGMLLLSAIDNFDDGHRSVQQQHMDVYTADFCAWRQWQSHQIRNIHPFRTVAEDAAFRSAVEAGRLSCDNHLAILLLNNEALVEAASRPVRGETLFVHQAEYMGGPYYYRHYVESWDLQPEELYYPWLERKPSGYWFGDSK